MPTYCFVQFTIFSPFSCIAYSLYLGSTIPPTQCIFTLYSTYLLLFFSLLASDPLFIYSVYLGSKLPPMSWKCLYTPIVAYFHSIVLYIVSTHCFVQFASYVALFVYSLYYAWLSVFSPNATCLYGKPTIPVDGAYSTPWVSRGFLGVSSPNVSPSTSDSVGINEQFTSNKAISVRAHWRYLIDWLRGPNPDNLPTGRRSAGLQRVAIVFN